MNETMNGVLTNKKQENIKHKLADFFRSYTFSLLIALIVLCIVMSILSPYFFTVKNIMNIGLATSVSGTMVAGLTVYMLMGSLELSQYATAALSQVIMGVLMVKFGLPVWAAILCALITSLLCGVTNATLLTKAKIPPIIVTLGTMSIFRALAYTITDARNIPLQSPTLRFIGQGRILGIPTSMWVMLIAFLVAGFILNYTAYGRKVYAVGANPRAAHLSGINVNRTRFIGMLIASFSAGIAGVLLSSEKCTTLLT